MSVHVQRIVNGTPKILEWVTSTVRGNSHLGLVFLLFCVFAAPVAIITFVAAAYMSGEESP